MEISPWHTQVAVQPDLLEEGFGPSHFAVHLGEVWRGRARCPEVYRDPERFFSITHLGASLQGLLSHVWGRLRGAPGERVLRLQAGFGGGKSHALLALYHGLVASPLEPAPPPNAARIVLSGLDFDPREGLEFEGHRTHTLWGALAMQMGGPEAFAALASHDADRIAPGGALLQRLLEARPALLLLDELLLYVEKTRAVVVGDSHFGRQNLLFLQTLTEVVRALPQAAMVYALQASADEAAGDDALLRALERLSNRLESQRQVLASDELLQVLRKRLFVDLGPESLHHRLQEVYSQSQQKLRASLSQRAPALGVSIAESYPFHPALVELLTESWWSIPSYQRTRGALQLLSEALRLGVDDGTQGLWSPAQLPLHDAHWRRSLLRQLSAPPEAEEAWGRDIWGTWHTSEAAQELARCLFFYSFGGRGPRQRGLLASEWCLRCARPGLHPATLLRGLEELQQEMHYLKVQRSRFRLSPEPNLRHRLDRESARWEEPQLRAELRGLLAPLAKRPGVVLWPEEPRQIPDEEPELQLVYLPPDWHALSEAALHKRLSAWLAGRGPQSARLYRNGLVFLQPSSARLELCEQSLRQWLSVCALEERGGLGADDSRELAHRKASLAPTRFGLAQQLYARAWVPQASSTDGENPWVQVSLSSLKAVEPEAVVEQLHGLLEERHLLCRSLTPQKLERLAFADASARSFQWLRDAFFRYLEFPRLASDQVLREAIAAGIEAGRFRWQGEALTSCQRRTSAAEELAPGGPVDAPSMAGAPSTGGEAPELQLSLKADGDQWRSLLPLLGQLASKASAMELRLELSMDADPPLEPRWVALKLEDALEELGVDYRLAFNSSSHEGK